MTMGEEILVLLRDAGEHQTADELLELAGGVFLESSFKTTLHDLATRKNLVKRFDLRSVGKGFLYGMPDWPAPKGATKPESVKQEPVDQKALRERLEREASDRAKVAAAPRHPIPVFAARDRISKSEEAMDKKDNGTKPAADMPQAGDPVSFNAFSGNCVPEKNRAELLPLIDAIDTGIYRIRGTDLLIQVKETGVDAYRIGE